MKPDEAMRLLTVLRGRGYTVNITGKQECTVSIHWPHVEDGEGWRGTARTTEEAILIAAAELYRKFLGEFHETAELLKPYVGDWYTR
jgi:hypothetical protein